jgi:hypothetical protein
MSDADLVVVRTFLNNMDAELALSALEAAGIHALIRRDDCGGIRPSLWLSGIGLLVRPEDAVDATALLDTPQSVPDQLEGSTGDS